MAVILDNKVGDVTVYKVERLLNRISAAGFCAGLDLGWRWPETACGVFLHCGLIALRIGPNLLEQVCRTSGSHPPSWAIYKKTTACS